MGAEQTTTDEALSVKNTFSICEAQSTNADGKIDKDAFKNCFIARKSVVEARYPGAFDFMRDGFGFLILMAGLVFIYFYIISPRIDKIMVSVPPFEPFNKSNGAGGVDDFGGDLKKLAKMTWQKPQELADKLINKK